MIDPGTSDLLILKRSVDHGNAMVLIVKREERDEAIAEANIGLEHVGPPGEHLIEAGCSEHNVGELNWTGHLSSLSGAVRHSTIMFS